MQLRRDTTRVKVAESVAAQVESGNKICACKKLDTTYTPNDDAQSSYIHIY